MGILFTATTATGSKLVVGHLSNKAAVREYCKEFGNDIVKVELTSVDQCSRIIEVGSQKGTLKTLNTLREALGLAESEVKGKKELIRLMNKYNVVIEVGFGKYGVRELENRFSNQFAA